MNEPRYLGVGLYSVPEAARIVGVNPRRLRRWISEYPYIARGVEYFHTPVIIREFESGDAPLTFLELVEVLFIKLFLSHGVSMRTIRSAAEAAAKLFETSHPFAVKRFDTDGRVIFATLQQEGYLDFRFLEELGKGQIVFDSLVRPFFRKLDYRGYAEALRYWPLYPEGRVVLDPERAFGKPIDFETGVPTRALYDAVRAGEGQDVKTVAEWFSVPISVVEAAVKYETSLAEAA